MTKLDLRQILKETRKSVYNGRTIKKLKRWKSDLEDLDDREDKRSLKDAIMILELVIELKKSKNKNPLNKFKQSFLLILFLFLLVGIQASINYNIGGSNKLIVAENISIFDGDVLMGQDLEVQGTANFTGNVTSGVDFCITDGLCLTTGVSSPWGNDTEQIFTLEDFPTFVNVTDVLFVNRTTGNVGIGTSTPTETLNIIGDLNQTQGNFTGNNLFGSMSNIDFTGVTITLSVVDQFENVTGLNGTEQNGFTFFNNTLVPQIPGRYLVRYSFSGTSAANSIYLIGISVNNVIDNGTLAQTTIGAGGSVVNIGGGGIIDLNVGDLVNLQVADSNPPAQDISYTVASVGILRISE